MKYSKEGTLSNKPMISWLPVRLLDRMNRGELSWENWVRKAVEFDLDGIEIHHTLLESRDDFYLQRIREFLDELKIKVSLITCSPDFAHPDPDQRKIHLQEMRANIKAARILGAFGVRVTTGVHHPMVREEDGISWVVENLISLVDFAEKEGVVLALENHYKDRSSGWKWPDFAHDKEVFLKIFRRIKETPIMVNFDCSNQVMIGQEPVEVLKEVKDKVASIHASDRFPGSYQHSVVGEGAVDYDSIFHILKEAGFSGWVSIEDGNPYGEEGFKKSLSFIKDKIDKFWG